MDAEHFFRFLATAILLFLSYVPMRVCVCVISIEISTNNFDIDLFLNNFFGRFDCQRNTHGTIYY